MGKEWLYWGGGGGVGASNSAKKRISRGGGGGVLEEGSTAPGCMCAVFQFWDLHHLSFNLPHHQARPSLSPETSDNQDEHSDRREGLEAPRNSLELNSCILEAASSSSTMKHDENLNIPKLGIRIKTNVETRVSTSSYRAKNEDILSSSSEYSSNSPGIKPPNLVARLMGLDLLPDQTGSPSSFSREQSNSPSLSNRSHLGYPRNSHHDVSGTVSLPETPRISLARKSDVDHHRLSLQCLKENIEERLDVSIFGVRKTGRKDIEDESASQYAKRIVKKMKEKVSRKVGVDITNTISYRQDNNLVVLKPKKMSNNALRKVKDDSSSSNQSTPSRSPRLSFLDSKKKTSISQCRIQKLDPVEEPKKIENAHKGIEGTETRENMRNELHEPIRMVNRGKKSFDVIRNKKDEPFIRSMTSSRSNVSDKKLKKNPPSKELLSSNFPTLVHKRKDLALPVTHFHDKQTAEEPDGQSVKRSTQQLPSFLSRSYKQETLPPKLLLPFQETNFITKNNIISYSESEYYRYYIQRILKRIGIDKDTPISLAKWYSTTHPLDPSVFHYLELFNPTDFGPSKLNRRCERKLVFHLVDELLVEILKLKSGGRLRGSELIDVLCEKIGEFLGANCQVLEDIDALVAIDMGKLLWFEDLESIVIDIVEKLVDENIDMVVCDVGYNL